MLKKTISGVVMLLLASQASAQIPVTDGLSLGQLIQQAAQMAKDYEEFQAQTAAAQAQVQAATQQLSSLKNISTETVMQQAGQAGQRLLENLNAAYGNNRQSYEQQISTTTDVVRQVNAAGVQQLNSMAAEARRIDDLAAQSQAATGTLQAQQAGNQINVELVQQLQALRAQQISQAQAQNAAALLEQQRRADSAAMTQRMLGFDPSNPQ